MKAEIFNHFYSKTINGNDINSRMKHFSVLDFIGAETEKDILTHLLFVAAHEYHKIF